MTKLAGHLKFIKLNKLHAKYGKGKNKDVVVIDHGQHGLYVMAILRKVAPNCTIHFIDYIQGNLTRIPEALRIAMDLHERMSIDVINMSFISGDTTDVKQLIYSLWAKNIILVAGTGNTGKEEYYYPASYQDAVIGVGSLDWRTGKVSNFTTTPYDILAPGSGIKGIPGFGTSYSSPHITGMAAVMLSKIKPDNIFEKMKGWLGQ